MDIKQYIIDLQKQETNPAELYQQYQQELSTITPEEAFEVFTQLKDSHYNELEILEFLDKVVHVFYGNLKKNRPQFDQNNQFLQELLKENRLLEKQFDLLRPMMKQLDIHNKRYEMMDILKNLKNFYPHYEKKENLLFPLLESKDNKFSGLSIMWALHNEIKDSIDHNIKLLENKETNNQVIIESISKLFFDMLGLIHKEENILFPAAMNVLTKKEWNVLAYQAKEYPGALYNKEIKLIDDESLSYTFSDDLLSTSTGHLRLDEILMIFNTLELDMTYVDENNKVRYFTRPKDRIFPRSSAVIGRDVKNCHPPQSVDVVLEIVEAFRAGLQDKASFWIDFKGRKILIEYFALRDQHKKYRGVLEVSSDITEIQKLEGQQRLAQYSKAK